MFRRETFRPLIEPFFERVTEEQWRLMTTGSPDDATKIQLAEMILGLLTCVTNTVLMNIKDLNKPKSQQFILSSLEDSIPVSLSYALGIPEQSDNINLRRLSDSIQKEVQKNIESALSSRPVFNKRITPPFSLNTMVSLISKLLKTFAAKIKKVFEPRVQKKKRKEVVTSIEVQNITGLEEVLEPFERPEEVSSQDSIKSKTSETLQKELRKELSEVIAPLVDEVSDSQYLQLRSERSQDVKALSDELADLICEQMEGNVSYSDVRLKIKNFFAKCFVEVLIWRLVEELRKKYPQKVKAETSESVQSLIDEVIKRLQDGEENSLVLWFNDASNDKVLDFSKEMTDLIYSHLLPEINSIMEQQPPRTPNVPASDAKLYADIQAKVWVFVELMNWFMKTEVNGLSERVKLPFMSTDPLPDFMENAVSELEGMQEALKTDKQKSYIRFFS